MLIFLKIQGFFKAGTLNMSAYSKDQLSKVALLRAFPLLQDLDWMIPHSV